MAAIPAPGSAVAPSYTLPTTPGRAMATLITLGFAAFLIVTNEIAPLGLITVMADDLGRSPAQLGLATTVFAFVVMVATVPLTLLTTRFTRRWLLVATMLLWSAGALVAGTAATFEQLLAGRVITALGHAVFWAVVTPAAAGMFPPAVRGSSITKLLIGASGAGIVGLPAATWLAQQTDWRVPFLVLAGAGVLVAAVIAALMPSFHTEDGTAARGDFPSLRRYLRVLVMILLIVTAMGTTWTYITPYLTEVSGFAAETVPLMMMLGGGVGVITMWAVGRYIDRWPVRTPVAGMALMLVMWVGLALFGASQPVVVVLAILQGFAWSIVVASMVNWAMRHTPWSSDIGVGAYAATFNAGNAVGSLIGAGILASWGVEWLPYASVVLTVGAVALALSSRRARG